RKLRHEKISFGRQGDSTQTKTVETLYVQSSCAMIAHAPNPLTARATASTPAINVATTRLSSSARKRISRVSSATWVCPTVSTKNPPDIAANNGPTSGRWKKPATTGERATAANVQTIPPT